MCCLDEDAPAIKLGCDTKCGCVAPCNPRPPTVFKVTHVDIKLIEVEGKIHPHENLISLDFSELFVLHPDC